MISFRIVDLPDPIQRGTRDDIGTLVYDIATYHFSVIELVINGIDAYSVVRDEGIVIPWDFLSQHIYELTRFSREARKSDLAAFRIKRVAVDEGIIIAAHHQTPDERLNDNDIVDLTFSHDILDVTSKELVFTDVSLDELELAVLKGLKEFYDRVLEHYLNSGVIGENDILEWEKCWKAEFRCQ